MAAQNESRPNIRSLAHLASLAQNRQARMRNATSSAPGYTPGTGEPPAETLMRAGHRLTRGAFATRAELPAVSQARKPAGFTLVELLVVIGIIAVLMGLLLPVVNKARAAGYRTACQSNVRQLYIGILNYCNDNHDWYPTCSGAADGKRIYPISRRLALLAEDENRTCRRDDRRLARSQVSARQGRRAQSAASLPGGQLRHTLEVHWGAGHRGPLFLQLRVERLGRREQPHFIRGQSSHQAPALAHSLGQDPHHGGLGNATQFSCWGSVVLCRSTHAPARKSYLEQNACGHGDQRDLRIHGWPREHDGRGFFERPPSFELVPVVTELGRLRQFQSKQFRHRRVPVYCVSSVPINESRYHVAPILS